ncbi:MAG TPA: hypothetical protein PK364_10655 [Synergistaceae bacterium]|nr:hypothetical protein [Synergistaceae bacterium]
MRKIGVLVGSLCLLLVFLCPVQQAYGRLQTLGDVLEEGENARINWTEGYIEATGQAVPPSGKENTSQGKLLARRGAVVDLQRNLLEFVKGVRVDAKTSMQDFMVNDYVSTQVQGTIKRVEIIDATWDGEIYSVTGRIKMEDMRKAVTPALPEQPGSKPVTPQPKGTKITGLVIDVRHLPLIPAMTFRVLDESGKEVYGLSFVDKERFLSSGLCDYQTNLDYAKNAPRVADRPLVVKAVKVVGPQNVDIVIPNSAASKIRSSTWDFRTTCRVTVVKR